MAGEAHFRKDLFRGTAEYYDAFRSAYPAALLDDLCARAHVGGTSRLLDLACGTGQIAFALAGRVASVWAVDQEPEFVALGERKAQRLGVANIHWITGSAEDVALEGVFDLVAIGNAFHRLERDAVARRLVPHLAPGGCVALLWGDTPAGGEEPWQHVLNETLERWVDAVAARDRVPDGWEQAINREPHEQVLRRAGLVDGGRYEFAQVERWNIESLTGFVYSTSFLNRAVLGSRAGEFEHDLRSRLLASRPDGVFEAAATFAYELARRS